jgi:hypothetical protein
VERRLGRPFTTASAGYAGTSSDGLNELDASRTLTPSHGSAIEGNVVLKPGSSSGTGR